MRILILGAGGVGSAAALIAARREFPSHVVVADYDRARADAAVGRDQATRGSSPHGRRVRPGGDRDAAGRPGDRRRARRDRPALHDADLPCRAGAAGALRRHGDVAVAAAPVRAVRAHRGDARRRAVRPRRRLEAIRPDRAGGVRRRTRPRRRVRPLRRRPPVQRDRRGRCARRGEPHRGRLRVRAVLLDLDHDRGVPEPAAGLREGPRLVHHRAVQRARGVRLPRGHRAGRVRQRRARGGRAHPALARRQAGHVQVRAGQRVHRRAQDAAQARPGQDREGPGR